MTNTSVGEITHGSIELNIKYLITLEYDLAVKDKTALETDMVSERTKDEVLFNRFVKGLYKRFLYIYNHTEYDLERLTTKYDENGNPLPNELLESVKQLKNRVLTANNGTRKTAVLEGLNVFEKYTRKLKEQSMLERVING